MDEKNRPGSNNPDEPLRELRTVWGPIESEVIRAFLESHGISCEIRGRIDQNIYPFSADGLGQIRIYVLERDYKIAEELLADLPKPEATDDFQKDEEEG
jgi:hypothetical protein